MNFPAAYNCFAIDSEEAFNKHALALFNFQANEIPIYRDFLTTLKVDKSTITNWKNIPCLPISFFKTHQVIAKDKSTEITFNSSGTTGMITSSHHVAEVKLYEESFLNAFEIFYGNPKNYCVLALLPAYLEREGSSLVYMADRLIKESNHTDSGFYLNQYEELSKLLSSLRDQKQPTILIGVTFALLDLVEQFPISFPKLIIMETGGMKGRRKEMIREELHQILTKGFNVNAIHSEYGMTELLSQAYSKGDGIFNCPPWMKVAVREINDPFANVNVGQSGGLNIIDLANVYSCAFIATQDLGKQKADGSFEVLGRFDNSDLRGCNLLVQ
jgi:phenylacetate-coenzyme A ligase PaaK-like adenylate-forming protein